MADENDDAADTGEEVEGFSDAEIQEQIAPFLSEVDADYDAAFEPLADEFKKKGPPQE